MIFWVSETFFCGAVRCHAMSAGFFLLLKKKTKKNTETHRAWAALFMKKDLYSEPQGVPCYTPFFASHCVFNPFTNLFVSSPIQNIHSKHLLRSTRSVRSTRFTRLTESIHPHKTSVASRSYGPDKFHPRFGHGAFSSRNIEHRGPHSSRYEPISIISTVISVS